MKIKKKIRKVSGYSIVAAFVMFGLFTVAYGIQKDGVAYILFLVIGCALAALFTFGVYLITKE